jgi:hypothetical protein
MQFLRKRWKEILAAQTGAILMILGAWSGSLGVIVPHLFNSSAFQWFEIAAAIVLAWILFPWWCPMDPGGNSAMLIYAGLLMAKGWMVGYGWIACYRRRASDRTRWSRIGFWYCTTNLLGCLYLIVYGFRIVVSEPVALSNTLSVVKVGLIASIATSGAILAIVLTYIWILRKLLQADDEQL